MVFLVTSSFLDETLRVILLFTKIFVFNDCQIAESRKQSSRRDESSKELHCFKKSAVNKFSWEQKRRVKTIFEGKRIWKTQG